MPRLNKQQIEELQEDLSSKQYTLQELSQKYNTSIKTISTYKQKFGIQSINQTQTSNQTQQSMLFEVNQSSNDQSNDLSNDDQSNEEEQDEVSQEVSQQEQFTFNNEQEQQKINTSLEQVLNQSLNDVNNKQKELSIQVPQRDIQDECLSPLPKIKKQKHIESFVQQINPKDIQTYVVNDDQDLQQQRESRITQIRRYIQKFSDQQCIKHIIGSNDKQIQQFISKLQTLDNQKIEDICQTLKFELKFNKFNNIESTYLKHVLLMIEKLCIIIGFDISGSTEQLFQDEDFIYHLDLVLCEISYVPSSQQILFAKFMKTFYINYYQNKQKKLIEQKLKQTQNMSSQDDKFNQL